MDYYIVANLIKSNILTDNDQLEELHKVGLIKSSKGINDSFNFIKNFLLKMNIYVLEPISKNDFFFTSDNPGFTLIGGKVFNTDYGKKFDLIGFPLNSKQMIVLEGFSNQSPLEISKVLHFRKINGKEVDRFNSFTIVNSNESIFCENKQFLKDTIERLNNKL